MTSDLRIPPRRGSTCSNISPMELRASSVNSDIDSVGAPSLRRTKSMVSLNRSIHVSTATRSLSLGNALTMRQASDQEAQVMRKKSSYAHLAHAKVSQWMTSHSSVSAAAPSSPMSFDSGSLGSPVVPSLPGSPCSPGFSDGLVSPTSSSSSREGGTPPVLHALRHVFGFRKLNRVYATCSQIDQKSADIAAILDSPILGFDMGVEGIMEMLNDLHETQSKLFQLSDEMKSYEALDSEVRFMRQNLEKCVRNSVLQINQGRFDNSVNKVEDIVLAQNWSDHNEFQELISQLVSDVTIPWVENSKGTANTHSLSNGELTRATISKELRWASEVVHEIRFKPRVHAAMESRYDLEDVQVVLKKLDKTYELMNQTLKHHRVVFSVLLDLMRQVKATDRYLQVNAQMMNAKIATQQDRDRLLDEKLLLLDLINDARTYDKAQATARQQAQKQDGQVLDPEFGPCEPPRLRKMGGGLASCNVRTEFGNWKGEPTTPNTTSRIFDVPSPDSPASPIWAQSWAKSPRLLRTRTALLYSERPYQ